MQVHWAQLHSLERPCRDSSSRTLRASSVHTQVAAHRAKLLFGLARLPPAAELHGNMSQTGRLEALDSFRKVSPSMNLEADTRTLGRCATSTWLRQFCCRSFFLQGLASSCWLANGARTFQNLVA